MAMPKIRPHRAPERAALRAVTRPPWRRLIAQPGLGEFAGARIARSGGTAVAAVEREEQLLERGLAAHELRDADVGEDSQQGLDGSPDLAANPLTLDLHGAHAGNPREVWDRAVEGRLDAQQR